MTCSFDVTQTFPDGVFWIELAPLAVSPCDPVAPGQQSTEQTVTVAMQDSGGPYDYHLSHHLLRLAKSHKIPVRRDLFRYYHSDAQAAVTAGHDIRTALLAFGCDATHGYERTHIDSLAALTRLISAYLLSPPVFASDAEPEQASLERFSHQIEHGTQMESDTRVPPVDTLVGQLEDEIIESDAPKRE